MKVNYAYKFASKILRALAHPTRLKILYMMRHGEKCVCEIVPYTGLSQPTVSRHLKFLEESGILRSRKEGNKTVYTLSDKRIFKVIDSLDPKLVASLSQTAILKFKEK